MVDVLDQTLSNLVPPADLLRHLKNHETLEPYKRSVRPQSPVIALIEARIRQPLRAGVVPGKV